MVELVSKEDLRLALDNFAMRIVIQLGGLLVAVAAGTVTILKLIL